MTDTKHTPGPWKICLSKDFSGDVGITADGLGNVLAECFADIRRHGEAVREEALSNARLITAAPELLDALELHVAYESLPVDRGGSNGPKGRAWNAFIAARDSVIAKAKGTGQ